jgi:hypothetical protein
MQPLGTRWGGYKFGSLSLCRKLDVGGVLVGSKVVLKDKSRASKQRRVFCTLLLCVAMSKDSTGMRRCTRSRGRCSDLSDGLWTVPRQRCSFSGCRC